MRLSGLELRIKQSEASFIQKVGAENVHPLTGKAGGGIRKVCSEVIVDGGHGPNLAIKRHMHEDPILFADVVIDAREIRILSYRLIDRGDVGVRQRIGLKKLRVRHVGQKVLRPRV